MKYEWKEIKLPLIEANAEEMWIADRQIGFLVARHKDGKRWCVFHRRKDQPLKGWFHPCESLEHGKEIAEAWANRQMN